MIYKTERKRRMEKITLVSILTDYDETYEMRTINDDSDKEGEINDEQLFVSACDGDKYIP